jgi:hypothetical protein
VVRNRANLSGRPKAIGSLVELASAQTEESIETLSNFATQRGAGSARVEQNRGAAECWSRFQIGFKIVSRSSG